MELKHVLIVEDEKDIQMIAEMGLKDLAQIDVTIANDGLEALKILETLHPDLILMDVMMPNMTGHEVLEVLAKDKILKEIPVVIMTAKSEHEQEDLYTSLGAIDVIIKPFDPVTLAEKLNSTFKEFHEKRN